MNKPETIAELLAEYRRDLRDMDARRLYLPNAEYLRILLNRVEGACRREADKLIPASNIEFSDGNGRRQIAVGWVKKGGEAQ